LPSASGPGFCAECLKLPADGVLVVVYRGAIFDPASWNMPVHVVQGDGYCPSADEVLSASIYDTYITACLKGPDLSSSEAQFRAFVVSIPLQVR
jgi:hypothetical protein